MKGEATLTTEELAWRLAWDEQGPRSTLFEDRRSGRTYRLDEACELGLLLSGAPDRVAEPLVHTSRFELRGEPQLQDDRAVFALHHRELPLAIRLCYQLEGPTRRKWVEVENQGSADLLLLDVELDDLAVETELSGGGRGEPVFLGASAFAAIEHPSGLNQGEAGRIQLKHFPGRRLAPGATWRSHTALVSVAEPGQAREHFVAYIQQRCRRQPRALSVYTPFGINNQWGACPTLDDEQTLEVLNLLEQWQKQGVRFDYFTLDTGWSDPSSDLTRFRPVAYPKGPQAVIDKVAALGMKFGLWFGTSWGTQSCWEYEPAYAGQPLPGLPYKEGYAQTLGGITFCLGEDTYFQILKNAILHHIRENGVRFIKLDGGMYNCDDSSHGHLPGPYATEMMYERLIELAESGRALAPDLFVMWYWGLRSPFWALHGDSIFESGLHMEGSGTSATPALYYRDSVTLAQDQNAQHARTIPPLVKDSLGVWLSDSRWGNFMGRERWQEALVMDLGRGNLLFPNLWGNLFHLDEGDQAFLARIGALAQKNEALFLHRRTFLGDPWKSQVYGYAHCQGRRGFLFVNNPHFTARQVQFRLGPALGLEADPGAPFQFLCHFPEQAQLLHDGDLPYKYGEVVELWLRPFEVLMLELKPWAKRPSPLPRRVLGESQAADLGCPLELQPAPVPERLKLRFADSALFAARGFHKRRWGFAASLPALEGLQPVLAVAVRLRQGEEEWRYSPAVVEITQLVGRIGEQSLIFIPTPDSRQYGNTQKAGCSWVVFKTRLSPEWSGQPLELALHAWLPAGVEARTEAWIVRQWWPAQARPTGDGYYTYAPS